MKGCSTCKFRWLGNTNKTLTWSQWYCGLRGDVRRKDLPVIGNDKDLKAAKGCKEWGK